MESERHAIKLLEDALACLESSCPPKGGRTDKVCRRIRRYLTPPETEYAKALRTGVKPAIWPPIMMTREELNHFRATHGIKT